MGSGKTDAQFEELGKSAEKTGKQVTGAAAALDKYTKSGSIFALGTERITGVVGNQTKAIDDLVESMEKMGSIVGGAGDAVVAITSVFPGLGTAVSGAVKTLQVAGKAMATVGGAALTMGKIMAEGFDTPSRSLRQFDQQIFEIGKQFGGTVKEAAKFADALNVETASKFSRSLYITKDQMIEFTQATARTSLSLDQMNETVETGIGTTTMFAVAAAQAAAMGVTMGDAAEYFNTAMNKQGKSAQEAAGMIAGFSAVAKETGLRASKVASTLNGAVEGFTKLGMSADFGRPILEGFGRTMKDMGLGIENATSLTTSLSSALAGLTTDYASAYIMFQKGGLDIGGGGSGGALGASIGLQAAMLDAEKTGDQGDIANKMVHGLRDTLASFAGGDIVTVQQAAESPELQKSFYVQQQMLQKQFGVSSAQDATRVLDMLSQLDEATRTGNASAQQDLEKQLKNEMDGRDKNLDLMEKINQEVAIQSNLLVVEQRILLEGFRSMAEPGTAFAIKKIQGGGEAIRKKAATGADKVIDWLAKGTSGQMNEAQLNRLSSDLDRRQARADAKRGLISEGPGGRDDDEQTIRDAALVMGPGGFKGSAADLDARIEQAAAITAKEATDRQVSRSGHDTRAAMATTIAGQIKESLANMRLDLDVSEDVRDIVRGAAVLTGAGNAAVATPST